MSETPKQMRVKATGEVLEVAQRFPDGHYHLFSREAPGDQRKVLDYCGSELENPQTQETEETLETLVWDWWMSNHGSKEWGSQPFPGFVEALKRLIEEW